MCESIPAKLKKKNLNKPMMEAKYKLNSMYDPNSIKVWPYSPGLRAATPLSRNTLISWWSTVSSNMKTFAQFLKKIKSSLSHFLSAPTTYIPSSTTGNAPAPTSITGKWGKGVHWFHFHIFFQAPLLHYNPVSSTFWQQINYRRTRCPSETAGGYGIAY